MIPHQKTPLVLWALAVALTAAGCSGSSSSTTTASTTQTTETFSGSVPVGGSDAHNFSVSTSGTVTVTLTAASPPDAIVMGLGIGTPSGSTCALLTGATRNTAAGGGALAGLVTPGAFCVQVSDVSRQTSAVSYTVTVTHP